MFTFFFPIIAILYLPVSLLASTHHLPNALSALHLSPNAHIHLRDTPGYTDLAKRWSYWAAPDIAAIIEVATTLDVAETIRFANAHDVPYLAQSGAHGTTASLGAVKNGILIHLRRLDSITVSQDGSYATIGGGVKGVEVRDELWKLGKWTVTGLCECPGFVALALGGGHGILQGRYGLLSDQVLGMEVVLANGSAVTVSASSHADLFWAMQGAGHNFGVVTSMRYKVYDVPQTEVGGRVWSHEMLTYEATKENVESVFGLARDMLEEGRQPEELMLYGAAATDSESGRLVIMQHCEFRMHVECIALTHTQSSIMHHSHTSDPTQRLTMPSRPSLQSQMKGRISTSLVGWATTPRAWRVIRLA